MLEAGSVMKQKIGIAALIGTAILCSVAGFLLFYPQDNTLGEIRIQRGEGVAAVSRQLAENDVVYQRHAFILAAKLTGLSEQLKAGVFAIPNRTSAWSLAQHLQQAKPQTIRIRLPEGATLAQIRTIINQTPDLNHETANWPVEQLLANIAPRQPFQSAEGLLFPDTYTVDKYASDLQIYRAAYAQMTRHLQQSWQNRADNLPYQNPYQMLIMASIIEKETAHPDDRPHVAAVFVNRLRIGMRLQTDPTVIYGMGAAYQGNIRRADLTRDTPYNTYTRHGLPPTPIAAPGLAALQAAAKPAQSDYLYFVAKQDGSGKSRFSRTLTEHNAAVQCYILKRCAGDTHP